MRTLFTIAALVATSFALKLNVEVPETNNLLLLAQLTSTSPYGTEVSSLTPEQIASIAELHEAASNNDHAAISEAKKKVH